MPEDYLTNAAGNNADHHSSKYRFEEAIGDLVDNSIDAQASQIDVFFGDQDLVAAGSPVVQGKNIHTYPDGIGYLHDTSSAYLIVADNGTGMSATEFRDAVIKGQRRKYREYELGHFGVGLKKSTMSQCYEATIFTKKDGKLSIKRISSVHIQESEKDQLLNEADFTGAKDWMSKTEGYTVSLDLINRSSSGTVVLMEGLHKIEKSIGSSKTADRNKFINDIKSRIRAYLGVIFERYIVGGHKIPLTTGKTYTLPKIDIKFSATSVIPIDPFFKKFEKIKHNRWTLQKKILGLNTLMRIPGKAEKKIAMSTTLYIIPTEKDALSDPAAKVIEQNLVKSRDGLKRSSCQGIYIYRNQRLIEFATEDAWKGLLATHDSKILGRWEVHLPPHLPPNLNDLDFTLDSTKTESTIGKKTRDEMKRLMNKKYKWHSKDATTLKLTDRLNHRKKNPQAYETICKDCHEVGHFSKVSSSCKNYVAPPPTTPVALVPPVAPPAPVVTTPPTTPPSLPAGSHNVKEITSGDLVDVKGTDIVVNVNHGGFSDLMHWFNNK